MYFRYKRYIKCTSDIRYIIIKCTSDIRYIKCTSDIRYIKCTSDIKDILSVLPSGQSCSLISEHSRGAPTWPVLKSVATKKTKIQFCIYKHL